MKTTIKRNAIEQKIFDWAAPMVAELDVDLVDVHYRRENNKLFLRLFIDRRGGIDMDCCVAVNEQIDQLIDSEMPELNHDYFEVSSAGLDRPLITIDDFRRHLDECVEVNLYQKIDDRKQLVGELKSVSEHGIVVADEQEYTLDFEDIAKVKLHIEF